MTPTIATIICTMARPDDLRLALSSLASCSPPPNQVLVSDDSPEPDRRSETVCSAFANVCYRRGPRRGLGANRNAAVAAIDAEWIHFIDDDVTVPPSFYCLAAEAIAVAAERSLISGVEMNDAVGGDGTAVRITPPYAGFWPHMEAPAGRAANCVVINAALFPRELLVRTPFDERMKYGCEESDITCHAIARGYALTFDDRLCVKHSPSPQNRATYQRWVVASQVYAGLKRQWLYRGSKFRAAAFLLVAVPRLVLYHTRRGGPSAGLSALLQSGRGLRFFAQLLRERRSIDAVAGE